MLTLLILMLVAILLPVFGMSIVLVVAFALGSVGSLLPKKRG